MNSWYCNFLRALNWCWVVLLRIIVLVLGGYSGTTGGPLCSKKYIQEKPLRGICTRDTVSSTSWTGMKPCWPAESDQVASKTLSYFNFPILKAETVSTHFPNHKCFSFSSSCLINTLQIRASV